ncbi:hypothetical protein F5Y15DRAFT_68687 [Xylariaceae sp. FL0016]|nr:hypothetical protein F5Y15DRAFT_68687 [Xylariaceae sp. FL0016]
MSVNTGLRLARVQCRLPSHTYIPISALVSSRLSPLYPRRSSRPPPRTPFRAQSTSSAAQTKGPSPSRAVPSSPDQGVTTQDGDSRSPPDPAAPLLSDPLNPPASTRPPPLDLPARAPDTSTFSHLFAVGKAYMRFYKTGLSSVLTNRRLLRQLTTPSPKRAPQPTDIPTKIYQPTSPDNIQRRTRAFHILRARTIHDLRRLPVFALLILICGEFTPLVVLAFPKLTPHTCRIPRQIAAIRRAAEDRRAASYRTLRYVDGSTLTEPSGGGRAVADGHICRVLGLSCRMWDRVGMDGPFARRRAQRALRNIVLDDRMVGAEGGVRGLLDEEVVLACEDRGINVVGREVGKLREELEAWVSRSMAADSQEEAVEKVREALLRLEVKA